MYKLYYSQEAQNDLDEIGEYINDELQNSLAVQKTVTNILDTIEKLQKFPQIGAPLSLITGIEDNYRHLVCGNYIVFYRVENTDVLVDRILNSKRDYLRILFDN
jgi:toxin ParE1/3/4